MMKKLVDNLQIGMKIQKKLVLEIDIHFIVIV